MYCSSFPILKGLLAVLCLRENGSWCVNLNICYWKLNPKSFITFLISCDILTWYSIFPRQTWNNFIMIHKYTTGNELAKMPVLHIKRQHTDGLLSIVFPRFCSLSFAAICGVPCHVHRWVTATSFTGEVHCGTNSDRMSS